MPLTKPIIQEIIKKEIGAELDARMPAFRKMFESVIEEKLALEPGQTLDNKLMGELKTTREEFYAPTAKVDRFKTRVDNLEIETFGQIQVALE